MGMKAFAHNCTFKNMFINRCCILMEYMLFIAIRQKCDDTNQFNPDLLYDLFLCLFLDHGEPCTESDASYCMNEGKCFKIPSMSTLTCV